MNIVKVKIIILLLVFWWVSPGKAQEKTPYEITAKSDQADVMANRSTFAKRFPYVPMHSWQEGIRFIVAPVRSEDEPRQLPLVAYQSERDPLTEGILRSNYALRTMVFEGFEQRDYRGETFIYGIFDLNGVKFEYRFVGTEAMFDQDQGPTHIKGLIVLDEVEFAKKSLKGKEVYTLKRARLYEDGSGRVSTGLGKKFGLVEITDVGVGSLDRPIHIIYKDETGTAAFFDVCLTGVNVESKGMENHFDEFFSLKDPHDSYPDISDARWEKIQKGQLAIGMSLEECQLSWGPPQDINRITEEGVIQETWGYPGYTLEFENERLKRAIQK